MQRLSPAHFIIMYPSFEEFMRRKNMSDTDDILLQAIAALSVQDSWSHMTPEEIWNTIVMQTKIVKGEIRG